MDELSRVRPTVLNSPLDPTRARPEPWFVGSGRGLMVAVVSLCAILLILRGITIVWMAEAAWDWLQRPGSTRAAALSPSAYPTQAVLPSTPSAPPDTARRPVATPKGNFSAAFSRDAYPLEALRRDEEGRTVARLSIDVDGHPSGCSLVESSGSASLDRATCAIGFAKLRFDPARDPAGQAMPSRYDLKVRWALED